MKPKKVKPLVCNGCQNDNSLSNRFRNPTTARRRFHLYSLFVLLKQIVNIVEGKKLINIIFMRVYVMYVCMMHVLDTFPGC